MAAMSSGKQDLKRIVTKPPQDTGEISNHMPFCFISATFPALLQFLAYGLRKQDVPLVCEGSSIMSKPTLFVTILNSCGLNQSSLPFSKRNRQHRRSRLLYIPLCGFSHCLNTQFSFWSPPASTILLGCAVLSNFKLICSHYIPIFSTDQGLLLSQSAGLNTWPGFRTVNFLNKVSFNET